ncbi:VacB/RNase II family 3'-5' exoribonuclease [Aurantivibrio plasticivorans]
MLNKDALSQLSQLKKDIIDSKDIATGVVRGTAHRYGFVSLDDGRDAFLPPDTMNRVLPGDKVRVCVNTNDKGKLDATLEKLIKSDTKQFVGRYQIKGKNHFVEADAPQLNRWFFVPPKERKKYQQDDLVKCFLTRHPFRDGRAQVSIQHLIGKPDEAGIERRYLLAKFVLRSDFSQEAVAQAVSISDEFDGALPAGYQDFRALPFYTIDAETTQDMDDALHIESTDNGWTLYSAIADPSALVEQGSPLDIEAQERACTAYLTGGTINMFPPALSEGLFSLKPEADRLALVCKMQVASDGNIASFEFIPAMINSKAKLSYEQVRQCIEGDAEGSKIDSALQPSLTTLQQFAIARSEYRAKHNIQQDDNVDYVYYLNDDKKIEQIQIRQTHRAHQLVEESMLATNLCAGAFLSGHKAEIGLFSTHAGFRSERLHEVEVWLKKDMPDYQVNDLTQLENFCHLIHTLQNDSDSSVMLATLRRLMQAGELSAMPNAHFGLGFSQYAMTTSPIRRYQDLHNHRVIKGIVLGHPLKSKTDAIKTLASQLQERINLTRQVNRQLNQWLLCHFMQDKVGQQFSAKIMAISNQGIALRLDDSGAEGFIQLRGTKENPAKYDSIRMRLTVNESTFVIEQPVQVKLEGVNTGSRQLNLSLIES